MANKMTMKMQDFVRKKVINCLEIVKEKYKESLFTDKKYKVRFPC